MAITIAICDEEKDSRVRLQELCGQLPCCETCQSFSGPKELLTALARLEADGKTLDLVLMDIQTADSARLQAAGEVRRRYPNVILIFMTRYPQYITKAFCAHPDQFLVKPVEEGVLWEAVRMTLNSQLRMSSRKRISFKEKLSGEQKGTGHVYFRQDEICYLEACGHYLTVVSSCSKPVVVYGKLSEEEKRLCHDHFLKPHRSYLVNMDFIRKIGSKGIHIGIDTDPVIPISRTYYGEVKKRYAQFLSDKMET